MKRETSGRTDGAMHRTARTVATDWEWHRMRRRDAACVTVFTGELPDVLDPTPVYVVGERRHRWFVALVCPCGCGETL